jgi:hypothetical protein
MSKTDRLKEEIGWLKVVFGILVATDISLIAWMAQNYNQAAVFLLLACTMVFLVFIVGIGIVTLDAIKHAGKKSVSKPGEPMH